MALSPAAFGGRTAGIEQQPGRAQHQALLIGRKNFLFANTPLGAQVSAVIYSLIETARETGLDPFCYLTWVLKTIPMLDRIVEGAGRRFRQMHLSLAQLHSLRWKERKFSCWT